ncbi:asparaginase, putative [Eimeria maxima]|uniref:Asparaginase, putative n=1 Tax=Eimeria maxima TaxID=5804 RepID=U6M766_EIMMA|nr:asparaginase, putative [Eimeria maxima]CDJ60027.1 asparaginase, putative [Eimeria maxima]
MTKEAIVAKLYYLMGKGYTGLKLKEMFERNLRGELTESPNKIQPNNSINHDGYTEVAKQITRGIKQQQQQQAAAAAAAANGGD